MRVAKGNNMKKIKLIYTCLLFLIAITYGVSAAKLHIGTIGNDPFYALNITITGAIKDSFTAKMSNFTNCKEYNLKKGSCITIKANEIEKKITIKKHTFVSIYFNKSGSVVNIKFKVNDKQPTFWKTMCGYKKRIKK